MLDRSDRDRVRDATDLVQLIGEHIALKTRGREHVGLCPFHEDHTPSFAVVTHKGNAFYKCHACGEAGDAFTFVQKFHRMDFVEALKFLAERAGIALQQKRDNRTESNAPSRSDFRKANSYAQDFFRSVRCDPQLGAATREAIQQRGISDDMVEQFNLGAAPDQWDGFFKKISHRPSSVSIALSVGLIKQRPNSEGCYDTFRNRLIFPISDETGHPVAFGARIINPEDEPKYLNSSESAIFNKSRTLYGLHLAKRAIIDANQAIVTEGYTDVIACHQAGITNVVGTLGTALTREHAAILARLCDTVIVLFDGDEAGMRAADRAVDVFFAAPVDVKVCVLSEGVDPDELLKGPEGVESFKAALEKSRDALEYKVDRLRREMAEMESLSGRQKRVEAFLAELCDLGFDSLQGVRKRIILSQLSDLLGVSPSDIEASMPRRRPRGGKSQAQSTGAVTLGESMTWMESESLGETTGFFISRARRIAEREFLSLLLFEPSLGELSMTREHGGAALRLSDSVGLDQFADPGARSIALVILPWLMEGRKFTIQELLAALDDDSETVKLATSLYFEAQSRYHDDEQVLAEQAACACRTLLERIQLDQRERNRNAVGNETGTDEASRNLSEVIKQIGDRRKQGRMSGAIVQGVRST